MKNLRQILLTACMFAVLAVSAEQADPVISSIQTAYQKAKESMKRDKNLGNEMVTTLNYTVHKNGNAQKRPIWGMFCRPWIYIRKRAKCPFSRILEAVAAIWPEKRP